MSGFAVREATPEDVDAIAALERDHLGPQPWSAALIAAGLAGGLPTIGFLVAVDDSADHWADHWADESTTGGGVVGHAVVSLVDDVAELQRLAVDPAHRRRGLATALVDTAVVLARRAECERMLLEVRAGSLGAQAFYAARGFTELHRRRRYYADGEDALVLVLDLGAVPGEAHQTDWWLGTMGT